MLMAFIAMVCILGLLNLGTAINNTYGAASTSLRARGVLGSIGIRVTGGHPNANASQPWRTAGW